MLAGKPSNLCDIVMESNYVAYRPRLNYVIDNVFATILLCQSMHWAKQSNPFYKFITPCKHEKYNKGDSWCEELSFSRHEVLSALRRIAVRVNKKTVMYDPDAYIWYWCDMSRLTWYMVNWNGVNAALEKAYPENPQSGFRKIHKADAGKSTLWTQENPKCELSIYKESKITIKDNNQRESSSSNSIYPGKRFDDDDLFCDLKDIGLSAALAADVLSKYDRKLVIRKLKDVMAMFACGKVNNLLGYANKVFIQELYSPKQIEAILAPERQRLIPESEPSAEMPDIDAISVEVIAEYVAQLPVHLKNIYTARGLSSFLIRMGLVDYAKKK